MAARRRRAAADDSQLSLEFLFGGNPDTEPVAEAAGTDQGAGDEPLRSPGDAALAEPSADPVRTDHGPGDVLHRARGAGGDRGRGTDLPTGGGRPAADPGRTGELPRQGGPDQHREADGRGEGPRGAGPA